MESIETRRQRRHASPLLFPVPARIPLCVPVPSLRLSFPPLAHTSTVCVLLKSWSSYRLRARACWCPPNWGSSSPWYRFTYVVGRMKGKEEVKEWISKSCNKLDKKVGLQINQTKTYYPLITLYVSLLTIMESLSSLAPCSSATAATTASCSSGRSRASTSASEVVVIVAIMM